MATTDDLRLKILDRPKVILYELTGTGDGSRKEFVLRFSPVRNGSVTVRTGGVEKVENQDFTLDYSNGRLGFFLPPPDGADVVTTYEFTVFSDSELETFLDGAGGNLALAAGEVLMSMITDRKRLITWSRGDTSISYDRLRDDLKEIAGRFLNQGRSEVGKPVAGEIIWEEIA